MTALKPAKALMVRAEEAPPLPLTAAAAAAAMDRENDSIVAKRDGGQGGEASVPERERDKSLGERHFGDVDMRHT